MARVSAYGASKAAVVRLVETLAMELAPRNIAVNAVAPEFVATDIHAGTFAAGPERAESTTIIRWSGWPKAMRESKFPSIASAT